MRISTWRLGCALLVLGTVGAASAQEGHPLKGSWIGTWASNETHGEFVLVVLDWDGQRVSGIINPGTDNIEIAEATLDPAEWTIRIEADAEDRDGNAVHYMIEGTIEDLELPNRFITGTWQHDGGSGAFEIRRQ